MKNWVTRSNNITLFWLYPYIFELNVLQRLSNVLLKLVCLILHNLLGEFQKLVLYSRKVNYTPNYLGILRHIISTNPEQGAAFANLLIEGEEPLADIGEVFVLPEVVDH